LQQILPGTGRCPVRAEGSHFEVCSAAEMQDPSVGFAATSPVRGGFRGEEVCSAAEMWDPSVGFAATSPFRGGF